MFRLARCGLQTIPTGPPHLHWPLHDLVFEQVLPRICKRTALQMNPETRRDVFLRLHDAPFSMHNQLVFDWFSGSMVCLWVSQTVMRKAFRDYLEIIWGRNLQGNWTLISKQKSTTREAEDIWHTSNGRFYKQGVSQFRSVFGGIELSRKAAEIVRILLACGRARDRGRRLVWPAALWPCWCP